MGDCAAAEELEAPTQLGADGRTEGKMASEHPAESEDDCCTTCGYVFCASESKCHKPWETECATVEVTKAQVLGGDGKASNEDVLGDEHPAESADDCCGTCGFVFCETEKKCHRPWVTTCGDTLEV